ncbi:zinc finger protein 184-like isoform X2 [Pantherophis guttatus]|nr:zinc finger protein 184-like isoform X2 [Pantherophis guttatus]
MAVADVALVPEAFMEVTVCSSDVQHTHLGRRQKTTYKNSVQGNYLTAAAIGRVHCHPSELLSRLDRGEEAWVPQIQSSDESADEGPIKPTLKQLPTGGTWWARYRSPVTYPSSESANSDNDQESEEEKPHRGSYPHRGGFRPTILRRNLFNNSKGNGSQSQKPREAYKHGSQLKKPSQNQLGKTKAETGNANESSQTKERAAGRDHPVSCPDCRQIFKSKISLSNHQRIHNMTKAYKCPDCEEGFSSKKVFDRHQRGHRAEAGNRPSYSIVKPQNMKLYECFACKKSFELREQFLLHQKSHTTQQPYECDECGEMFVQKELLDKHQNCHTTPKNNRKMDKKEEKMDSTPETAKKKDSTAPVSGSTRPLNIGLSRQQQDQVNLHKCQFCGKCLRFKSLLVDHERMHREARPYKCSQCAKSFLHKAILMSHMMTHMKQASRKHPKKVKSLAVKSALVDSEIPHKRGNPSKSRKIITRSSYRIWRPRKWVQKSPYQCQYCGKYLSTRIILADHEKLHTGERPYKCHKCTDSFIRKHHLFRHLAIHLREISNEDVKSLRIKSRQTMRIKRRHYGQKASEGLLPASDVTRRSGLAKHPKIPTQENYVCQHCGKCMRTKSSFVNHGKIHRRKQQPYPHLEREENTSQEEPLVSHQETHAGEKLSLCSDSKDKTITKDPPTSSHRVSHRRKEPHLCHKCGKTFDDNYSYTRHQRIHSGQKPFRCAACGKAFVQTWHLKRHEKTHLKGKFPEQPVVREVIHENSHLDRKLFKCSLCGKDFFQPWHLKRHKRIHLNEECRKLSAIMDVTRAFSNFPSTTASTEEGKGDPLGKALQLPLHPDEVIGLPHAQEEARDLLVPLEERSDTGAPEKHITVPVQLSRKFKENILLGHGEVSQAVKSERKHRRKDIFSIHQSRTCSKNVHSQSHKKDKNHDGWQLRPRASSIRKSKRETQLVRKRPKRCFCQLEEREMIRPNAPNPPRKVKYCDGPESEPCVSVSSSLFQGASKNHKPKDLCLELPCQKTFSREAQMKVTKSVVQRNTVASVAQERESLEANSSSQSCEKEKRKLSNVRDPAETRPTPRLSKSKTQKDHDRLCPLNACSNATAQNLGRAPLAQQLGEIQNPLRIQKRAKGRRSVELQKAILRKLQRSPSKGKTACDQQMLQMKHVCSRCKKSFRSRTNLLIHEKNHTENRPFPCIHCKKSFFSVTALKIHMRIHTGEKPFKCSECDFRCNVLGNLNRHKANHSQEGLQPCMHCGKSFWLNPELMTHLKLSGKKKAYACPDCEQASMHRNLLKRKRKKL